MIRTWQELTEGREGLGSFYPKGYSPSYRGRHGDSGARVAVACTWDSTSSLLVRTGSSKWTGSEAEPKTISRTTLSNPLLLESLHVIKPSKTALFWGSKHPNTGAYGRYFMILWDSNYHTVLSEISQSQGKYPVIPITRAPAGIKFFERKWVKTGGCQGLRRKKKWVLI